MNLSPVIISALFQFCFGFGWYDGYDYHIFSNKHLKKHKPRQTYSIGFPIWKKQHFWRKRRIPEEASDQRTNDLIAIDQLINNKRFFQYSPYFPSYYGKSRTTPNTIVYQENSTPTFNSFNVYRKNSNQNPFVRRNYLRPSYFPFYFKLPSIYLLHNNDLVGHMHSGTSESRDTFVNKVIELPRKPLLDNSFGMPSNLDKYKKTDSDVLVTERIHGTNKVHSSFGISSEHGIRDENPAPPSFIPNLKNDVDRTIQSESYFDSYIPSEEIFRNTMIVEFENQDRGFGSVTNKAVENGNFGNLKTSDPTFKDKSDKLTDGSFGDFNDYPIISDSLNTLERPVPTYGAEKTDQGFEDSHNTDKTLLTDQYGFLFRTSSKNKYGDQSQLDLQTEQKPQQNLGFADKTSHDSSKVHFNYKPLEFFNQGPGVNHGNKNEIESSFNSINTEEDGGFFNIAEEGSFNNDQSGCEGITTRSCETDTNCSCYGSFFCIKGKCSMITAKNNGYEVEDKDQLWEK